MWQSSSGTAWTTRWHFINRKPGRTLRPSVTKVRKHFGGTSSRSRSKLIAPPGRGDKSRPVACPWRGGGLAKGVFASKKVFKWALGHPAPRARRASFLGRNPGRRVPPPLALKKRRAHHRPP